VVIFLGFSWLFKVKNVVSPRVLCIFWFKIVLKTCSLRIWMFSSKEAESEAGSVVAACCPRTYSGKKYLLFVPDH
jgi:hypothetical protein